MGRVGGSFSPGPWVKGTGSEGKWQADTGVRLNLMLLIILVLMVPVFSPLLPLV
jgi:hypothetical protein